MVSVRPRTDVISLLHEQLPRAIRDRLAITVTSDPYHLRAVAVFKDEKGRVYQTVLERDEPLGLSVRIPESFIAHLCAVV